MKKLLLLFLLLCPALASAQNSRSDGIVFSRNGFPLPGPTVAVCSQTAITAASEVLSVVTITTTLNPPQGSTVQIAGVAPAAYNGSYVVQTTSGTNFTYNNPTQGLGAGTVFGTAIVASTPCTPLAPLCANASDTTCTSPNPVTGDGLGNYSFYVKPGKYTVQFYGSGLTTRIQPDQILACDPSSNCTVTGALTAGSVNSVLNCNSTQFSGSDIFAKCNAAWTSCSNACTVFIPAGTYNSVTTTLSYPMFTSGTAALVIDLGATINYTGTGYAIEALSLVGTADAHVNISGGRLVGTASGLAGIHLEGFNDATISNMLISGFTAGDAIFNQGANTVNYFGVIINGNKNGVHNVGIQISSVNFPPVGNRYIGGEISNNTQWGIFEDASQAATVGPNQNNLYTTVLDTNGVNGSSTSGSVFIQGGFNIQLIGCYFEYLSGAAPVHNVILGDATHTAVSPVIRDNWFGSTGSTNSINAVNSNGAVVDGNVEAGSPTNFFNQGTASRKTNIGPNIATSATNYIAGIDNGDTFVFGSSTGTPSSFLNASGVTGRGYGFNGLSGFGQDLAVRTRSGGTNSQVWQVGSTGATAATMSDAGALATTAFLPLVAGGSDAGSTALPLGNVWLGTAATNNIKLTGTAASAVTVTIPGFTGNVLTSSTSDPKIQECSVATTGATGGAAGNVHSDSCAWPTAFADTTYTVTCQGKTVTSGTPVISAITSQLVGSVAVNTMAVTAAASQFTTVYCIGIHN